MEKTNDFLFKHDQSKKYRYSFNETYKISCKMDPIWSFCQVTDKLSISYVSFLIDG
jgi:hypothetical protein